MDEERVVIITRPAARLGAAMAERFTKEGFRVVINYHRNENAARSLAEKNANAIGSAPMMIKQAEVADRESVREMFETALDAFGRVDILINSAGVNRDSGFHGRSQTISELR